MRDLIVFGEDWGALPSSTQHLIGHLSQTRKVLWVNSIGLRRPTLSWHDLKRACKKLLAPKTQTKKTSDSANFQVINPRTLPAPRSHIERHIANKMLGHQLRPIIRAAQLNNPILWTSLPTAVDMADQLNTSTLVYYCGDDFSALAGVDHHTVAQREAELKQRADLILAASETLLTQFPKTRTQLLPHGVDFQRFSQPCSRAVDLPNDGRPIAGFYGSLSEWLDIELLQATIQHLPNWHFVFIGKAVIDISLLEELPNTLFLGERSHAQLPSYVQHWNASLLPFIDNEQIRACNPLKLREYLAAGQPIISTPFPALTPYQHLLTTATNVDEMVIALQRSLQRPQNSYHQQQAVAQQTWQARAAQLSNWLETL